MPFFLNASNFPNKQSLQILSFRILLFFNDLSAEHVDLVLLGLRYLRAAVAVVDLGQGVDVARVVGVEDVTELAPTEDISSFRSALRNFGVFFITCTWWCPTGSCTCSAAERTAQGTLAPPD